jgi:Cysteine-rich secretory protein family
MNHGPRTFLAVIVLSCVMSLSGAAQASAACPDADTVPTADNLPQIRAALICLHNEEREKANVALLNSNQLLTTAAQQHADDMVALQYFGHDAPDGASPFNRMRRAGYIGPDFVWNAGETIAWASGALTTPRSVMNSWLKSTSQRLTLLAPDFRHIGVGVSLGAPVERDANASPAVTYTVDYGWRASESAVRACLRRAAKRHTAAHRRLQRAKCNGL